MNHSGVAVTIVALVSLLPISSRADHATAGFGSNLGGPVTTISAETLAKGSWLLGARLEYVTFDSFTDDELIGYAEADEDVHSVDRLLTPFLVVGFGATDGFTLSARLPYVSRTAIREGEIEDGETEVHNHGDPAGIGDLSVFGQMLLVSGKEGHQKFAAIAGIKAPTGKTDWVDDEGEMPEPDHQPGSGSWDFSGGLAFSTALAPFAVDASALYTVAGKGEDDVNLGDLVNGGLSAAYRIGSAKEHAHSDGSMHHHEESTLILDLVLEANVEWREKTDHDGTNEENTGGSLMYLSPGVRVGAAGHWSGFVQVGVPVMQDLNGIQHETDLRVLSGISFTP